MGVAALGLAGVLAMAPAVPALLRRVTPAGKTRHVPMPALVGLALLQTSAVVLLCAWLGTSLGPASGLRSRAFDPAANGAARGLLRSLSVGAGTGALGAFAALRLAPALVGYLRTVPVAARLLYGGLTEEVVVRWGLLASAMALLRLATPAVGVVVLGGVVMTNAVFAAAHLSLLRAGRLAAPGRAALAIFLVSLPWGWLAWALGLEAAMAAHLAFHAAVELGARAALSARPSARDPR